MYEGSRWQNDTSSNGGYKNVSVGEEAVDRPALTLQSEAASGRPVHDNVRTKQTANSRAITHVSVIVSLLFFVTTRYTVTLVT
jgi:hypothetical protein